MGVWLKGTGIREILGSRGDEQEGRSMDTLSKRDPWVTEIREEK